VDVLPRIIETLQKQGYEFITIDEMKAVAPRKRYGRWDRFIR
jgi:peptidoglycan/xylan/chitin deacetylase (PgdA/CDA1 family)